MHLTSFDVITNKLVQKYVCAIVQQLTYVTGSSPKKIQASNDGQIAMVDGSLHKIPQRS